MVTKGGSMGKVKDKDNIGFDFSLMKNAELLLLAELFEEMISNSQKKQKPTKKFHPNKIRQEQ